MSRGVIACGHIQRALRQSRRVEVLLGRALWRERWTEGHGSAVDQGYPNRGDFSVAMKVYFLSAIALLAVAGNVAADTTVQTEVFEGYERTSAITVPDCQADALIIALHGANGNHGFIIKWGIADEAEQRCKIVVAPKSLGSSWDRSLDGVDIPYIEHLIARTMDQYELVDLVFIGFSAGALQAQRLHCLGYGSRLVLVSNASTRQILDRCGAFDWDALLVIGGEDERWDDPRAGRLNFREFVDRVAEDSGCTEYRDREFSSPRGLTRHRRYAPCTIDVIVPMALGHEWWPPVSRVAFRWLFDYR